MGNKDLLFIKRLTTLSFWLIYLHLLPYGQDPEFSVALSVCDCLCVCV